MFCPKCGDQIEQNEKFCNKCGNDLRNQAPYLQTTNNVINDQENVSLTKKNSFNTSQTSFLKNINKEQKKMIFIGIGIGLGSLLFVFISVLIISRIEGNYYFSNRSEQTTDETVQNTASKKGKYSTVIITDNTYSGIKISTEKDAYDLISKDSVSQKGNCPNETKTIENEMIEKYGITAVNLCEMDVEFAREISNVFKKVYEEYPSVRGYLTNLTLINGNISNNYIAAFMPVFYFATSDSASTQPWVIKTQVLLNTSYFLNVKRLEAGIQDASSSGHFPPNATIYSPVAHELGHYLSFLAMMRNYELNSILLIDDYKEKDFYKLYQSFGEGEFSLLMITEAYEDYKRDKKTTLSIDEWRATISDYAVAKDNSGNYIYDETIAEAFHDVYLNGENAKDTSQYVVRTLKEKLEGDV